jgi:hypothetical protein
VTDPLEQPSTGARRGGVIASGIGVVALVATVAVFLAGGRPYGVNIGGGLLYLLGLGAGLTGTVTLWMAWSDRDERWTAVQQRRGLTATALALLLVCACAVVSLGNVADGGVQLALIAVTAVVLAVAVLLSRPPTGR